MPRPDVSEARKTQILQAALNVFSRKGLEKARMDDIADESGLSKGALYWYFGSKDELIVAILDFLIGAHLKELRHIPEMPGSAEKKLTLFVDELLSDLQSMQWMLPITYEFYALAFRHKTVRITMQHYLRSYLEILEPIFRQGVESGEFREVDPEQAAIAAGAMFEGTLLLWVYDPEVVRWEEHIRSGCEVLLKGLLCQRK
jgi:AcrR family transcriptional regulator